MTHQNSLIWRWIAVINRLQKLWKLRRANY